MWRFVDGPFKYDIKHGDNISDEDFAALKVEIKRTKEHLQHLQKAYVNLAGQRYEGG